MNEKTVECEKPSEDPPEAFWLGEAPSDVEIAKGRVFSGPVGKIHNLLLKMAHIRRARQWTTNTINFQLPDNAIENVSVKREEVQSYRGPWSHHIRTPVASGAYLPPEIAVPQLDRIVGELAEARPNVVVALGGLSVWAMLGLPGHGVIMRVRGTLHYSHPEIGHIKVLPTYHPGYITRTFNRWPIAVSDYQKAIVESAYPEIRTPSLLIDIPETPEDVEAWFHENLKRSGPLSVDIETVLKHDSDIDCIGFSRGGLAGMCVPLFDKLTGFPYWDTPEKEFRVRRAIYNVLTDASIPKLFQNGSYDVQLIWEKWHVKVRGYDHDTRLLHHSLYPELPKDLGGMAATYTNLPGWKPHRGHRAKRED